MSENCEIVEVLVSATSTCPATDVIMLVPTFGTSGSTVSLGVAPPVLANAAGSVSQVFGDAYALLTSMAAVADTPVLSATVFELARGDARVRERAFVVLTQNALSTGTATDAIVLLDVPQLLASAAQAASAIVAASATAVAQGTESAEATAAATVGWSESLLSAAAAATNVFLLREVAASVLETAAATDLIVASGEPQGTLLISAASATGTLMAQLSAFTLGAGAADAASGVLYKDPDRVAWLMNTETTAASWYDNFDFESIAQLPGKVLAVGPDGLYELTGATDAGEQIDARVASGFTDFGAPQTKRLDTMYFGYTSESRISVTAETYESGHPPTTYFLEQRAADVPRNSRVVPGKGLWGRYWRLTIRNVGGADFEVHDATADVAVSARRV